jgi:hypothetical protein
MLWLTLNSVKAAILGGEESVGYEHLRKADSQT